MNVSHNFIMSKHQYSESEFSESESSESELGNNVKKIIPINDDLDIDNIKNIMFEEIDENYSYGKYGVFKVVMMKSNGYVNVTKMCKDYNKLHEDDTNFKKKE